MAIVQQDQINEESQDSMNIQGQQAPGAQTPQPTQPSTPSQGGQSSSTIQTGQQAPTQQTPSNKPKKGVGSGMYSNLSKYKAANQPATQRMAQQMQKNVQQRAQAVQSGIQKKEQQFQGATQSERARLAGGQAFAKGLIGKAAGQVDVVDIQARQGQLQERIGTFGDLQEGGYQQDIQSNRQRQIEEARRVFGDQYVTEKFGQEAIANGSTSNSLQTQQQAAQQASEIAQTEYFDKLRALDIDPTQETFQVKNESYEPGSYTNQFKNLTRDEYVDYKIKQKQDELNRLNNPYLRTFGTEAQNIQADERVERLKSELSGLSGAIDPYRQAQSELASAQEAFKTGQASFEDVQRAGKQLGEQQRLFENRARLQNEMSTLEDKIQNAPEAVTPEEMQRFEQLREGVGKFQEIKGIDVGEEARRGRTLEALASRIPTERGQRELIKDVIGRSDYSRGQSALDTFLIGSDKAAREGLIRGVQEATKGLGKEAEAAQRRSSQTLGSLANQARMIKEGIAQDITGAETGITEDIQRRLESGEGTMLKDVQERMASGRGLTEQQMQALGLDKDTRLFGVDLGAMEYDPSQYKASDFATGTDVSRAEALAKLAGRTGQTLISDADEIRRRRLAGELTGSDRALGQQVQEQLAEFRGQETDLSRQTDYQDALRKQRAELAHVKNLYESGQISYNSLKGKERYINKQYDPITRAAAQRDAAKQRQLEDFRKQYAEQILREDIAKKYE